ncbi:hypothetical protein FAD_1696 [Ferroplasma acidiphilum]|uniref:Uncharacterized protein n=2 Tax=Ferroplasma acidiphilum TaxID=74969 RepID=A0A1V0N5Z1_9ARCH|nr:hypothetical protein [Ferroplasma acidiphilum]ARD85537.1 hypothetical protein FAD_1696 [Ferroplasma acidiphilum]
MVKIIGSIDNAAHMNDTYYLIFTDNEMYQFLTMSAKERLSDMWHTTMGNPERMAPVVGNYSNYKVTQEEAENIVMENARRGKEIEDNLETKLSEVPPQYTVIPYSTVDKAELSGGTVVSLPEILLHANRKKLKFHLVRCNFHGRGKLTDEIFSQYKETLTTAFGSKLKVKS